MPVRRKNAYGVTLVELMITLVVAAILAALAVPSFADFFQRYRLRGAGDAVISTISNARAEAVKSDLEVNVSFQGSGSAWCVGANSADLPSGGALTGAANACDCTNTSQCRVGGARMVTDSASFGGVAIGALPAAMRFDSKMGTIVPLGTRQVTLTSPNGKYDLRLQVNALGQAMLCVPAGKPSMSGVTSC